MASNQRKLVCSMKQNWADLQDKRWESSSQRERNYWQLSPLKRPISICAVGFHKSPPCSSTSPFTWHNLIMSLTSQWSLKVGVFFFFNLANPDPNTELNWFLVVLTGWGLGRKRNLDYSNRIHFLQYRVQGTCRNNLSFRVSETMIRKSYYIFTFFQRKH